MPSSFRCSDNSSVKQDRYCIRSYSVTAKGVTKNGDSIRIRRHTSNASVSLSSTSRLHESDEHIHSNCNKTNSLSSNVSSSDNPRYTVTLLGMNDVGKTSLVHQFISSDQPEYDTYEENRTVSVAIDEEETELDFVDHSTSERTSEELIRDFDVDVYVVIYSVTDKESYSRANVILTYLQDCDLMSDHPVILVGNKTDLVRLRTVSTEDGKMLAKNYKCKFIETSAWLNHNVDELLVGVTRQILLRRQLERQDRKKDGRLRYKGSKTLSRSGSFVRDIFRKLSPKSKSCNNLFKL